MADAFDRYTRTPITFQHLDDAQGKTMQYPPTMLEHLLSLFGHPRESDQSIIVDPQANNGKQVVMKHEIAHAILNKLGSDKALADANSSISVYPQISQAFTDAGFKDPNTEIPAFAASGELKSLRGQQPNWQDQYIQELQSKLFKMNPNIAKWYQSVSQGASQ